MKKTVLIRIMALFAIIIANHNLMYGQFTGTGSVVKFYTIQEVKDNASKLDKSDEFVKVKGFVVKQINKDTYQFKDSTGDITVEIDKKRLPDSPFDEKTEVVIIGEVDNDLMEPVEIEVKEMYFFEPENQPAK